MTSRIFRSAVCVAAVVLLCSLGVVMGLLYSHFTNVQIQHLRDELSLAVTGTEQYGNAFLENVEVGRFRLTWIDQDGTVLFDTQVDPSGMENHADRAEIRDALETGSGSALRTSVTLMQQTFYEAARLSDGTVLRISTSQETAWSLMIGMLWPLTMIALLAMALSALLARRMAKKIVEPLNRLDLEQPLKNNVYEEISPLLHRINRQHQQITAQMEELRHKADTFSQIIRSMQEGLVLIDGEASICNINPAAKQIFGVGDSCLGKSLLMIDRSAVMRDAVNAALDKGRGCARENRNGREYQFELSRIESDGVVIGAVMLSFDITDRVEAEQIRREFSANVSHELKTPLQSIIGSAELLESGMVKQEDIPRFVSNIHKESDRLVNLIEDIIRLSQMEEGAQLCAEQVDMLALAQEVIGHLTYSAAEKDVKIFLSGEGFCVWGIRRFLQEMFFNLCDNGIKYNVPGGTVWVVLEGKRLQVRDTGIGIPPEHQARVFERFYRVDKSHSRASGGTGLGLSIVKHAAAYHNAAISLESTVGKGTEITIQF